MDICDEACALLSYDESETRAQEMLEKSHAAAAWWRRDSAKAFQAFLDNFDRERVKASNKAKSGPPLVRQLKMNPSEVRSIRSIGDIH